MIGQVVVRVQNSEKYLKLLAIVNKPFDSITEDDMSILYNAYKATMPEFAKDEYFKFIISSDFLSKIESSGKSEEYQSQLAVINEIKLLVDSSVEMNDNVVHDVETIINTFNLCNAEKVALIRASFDKIFQTEQYMSFIDFINSYMIILTDSDKNDIELASIIIKEWRDRC